MGAAIAHRKLADLFTASKMTASQIKQSAPNKRSMKFLIFDISPDGANFWFDVSNLVLLVGAVLVALGTYGTIRFAAIKETISDERTAANEAETRRAVADSDLAREGTARANERIAELNNETERLKSDNLRLTAQLAPRSLSKEQFDEIQSLKGRISAVNLGVEDDIECTSFAGLLATALQYAGIEVRVYDLPHGFRGNVGLMLYDQHAFANPGGEPTNGEPLSSVLKRANLFSGTILARLPLGLSMPVDIPAIFVLQRPSLPFVSAPYFGPAANPDDPTPQK
jgi:hypothetical protein